MSRRERAMCAFPPLRVEFAGEPPETSLFHGQRRLKLVTHCRSADSFQQVHDIFRSKNTPFRRLLRDANYRLLAV